MFENQEQTEISRFYERLPKPTLIAIQELMDEEIYMREKVKEEKRIPPLKSPEIEKNYTRMSKLLNK